MANQSANEKKAALTEWRCEFNTQNYLCGMWKWNSQMESSKIIENENKNKCQSHLLNCIQNNYSDAFIN